MVDVEHLKAVNSLSMDNLATHPSVATVVKEGVNPESVTPSSSPSGWQLMIDENVAPLGNGAFATVFPGVAHFNGRRVGPFSRLICLRIVMVTGRIL